MSKFFPPITNRQKAAFHVLFSRQLVKSQRCVISLDVTVHNRLELLGGGTPERWPSDDQSRPRGHFWIRPALYTVNGVDVAGFAGYNLWTNQFIFLDEDRREFEHPSVVLRLDIDPN